MLRKVFIVLVLLLLSAGVAAAGDFDLMLKEINLEASTDIGGYKASLALEFGVSGKTVTLLLEKEKMKPGDVYMAFKLSNMTGKPLEAVVGEFKRSKGKGWGVIAKKLGIKPGSAEFHALKQRAGKDKGKDKVKVKDKGHPKRRK